AATGPEQYLKLRMSGHPGWGGAGFYSNCPQIWVTKAKGGPEAKADAKPDAPAAAPAPPKDVKPAPSPASAPAAAKPFVFPKHRISVVSPAYRANVKGDMHVLFVAPGMATAEATCWRQGTGFGADSKITPKPVALDPAGAGYFTFPADEYPHGPINVRIIATSADGKTVDNCYLELFNDGGVRWKEGLANVPVPPQAEGMTLTYSDDFEKMPTISRTGAGATYCSRKPDGTEYGDAVFAEHKGPHDPFHQTETWLRIRTTYQPDVVDPFKWNRKYTTGFLASLREDGTGFHTQGGRDQYFECRMVYGAAPGIWPAFWLLSSNNYKGNPGPCDELDILENYMPWPDTFHLARHQWGYGTVHEECQPPPKVTEIGGKANTVQTFHTYGCLIEKDTTTYYFDDVKVWSHPTQKYSWEVGMYFMINNAFKTSDGDRNGTFLRYGGACDLWVDWVRVFERK
ncbi:MAG TPA: family 16 glycosylhydrolase, partial [Phycisphaerae bacterium]|nr:family 16 glycosylhydrolase [Phycisphaerae bacterium]